jgi:hypothetical protein
MAEENQELGPEDFEKLAAELDSKGSVEIPEPSAKSEGGEPPESESRDDAEEVKPRDSSEGEQPEEEKVPERKPETREESEYSKAQKDRERLDRNWEKQQQLADQVRRDREQFEREKAEWQKQREPGKPPVSDKDEKGYSAEDYERAVDEFLLDGNKDLAAEARERAKALRIQTHQRLWMEHLETVKKENPGIDKEDHPLHKVALQVLKDIPILNMAPDGAKVAVRIAKAEASTSLLSDLRAENTKLKNEIKRLNESLEIGGSGPMRMPSDKAFEEMTPKEQERELIRMAEEADRMGIA